MGNHKILKLLVIVAILQLGICGKTVKNTKTRSARRTGPLKVKKQETTVIDPIELTPAETIAEELEDLESVIINGDGTTEVDDSEAVTVDFDGDGYPDSVIVDGEEIPLPTDGGPVIVGGDYEYVDGDGETTVIIDEYDPDIPDVTTTPFPELVYPYTFGPWTTAAPVVTYPPPVTYAPPPVTYPPPPTYPPPVTYPPPYTYPPVVVYPTAAPPPPRNMTNCNCTTIINNNNYNYYGSVRRPRSGKPKIIYIKRRGQKQRMGLNGPGVKRRYVSRRNLQKNLASSSGAGKVQVYRVLKNGKRQLIRSQRKKLKPAFQVKQTSQRQGTLTWRKVSPVKAKRLQKAGYKVGTIRRRVIKKNNGRQPPQQQTDELTPSQAMRFSKEMKTRVEAQSRSSSEGQLAALGLPLKGALTRKHPRTAKKQVRQNRG